MAVDSPALFLFSLFLFFALCVYFSLFPLDVVHTPHTTFCFLVFPFALALKVLLLLRPTGIPALPLPVLPPGFQIFACSS